MASTAHCIFHNCLFPALEVLEELLTNYLRTLQEFLTSSQSLFQFLFLKKFWPGKWDNCPFSHEDKIFPLCILKSGKYPDVMSELIDLKSVREGRQLSRLPKFTEEEQRYVNRERPVSHTISMYLITSLGITCQCYTNPGDNMNEIWI